MMKRHVGVLFAGTSLLLGACAGPVILGINLGTASTVGSVISTAATGKGLGEHALSAATEKDCAIIEGAFRSDRKFCEEHGAEATKSDFKGLAVLFEDRPQPASATMLADAPAETGDIVQAEAEAVSAEVRSVETAVLEPPAAPAVETAAAPPPSRVERAAAVRIAAAPPAPRPKPAAADLYTVQVGTFARPTAAATLVKQLREAGYQASHKERRGMTVVRVRGFSDAGAANAAAARIGKTWRTEPMVIDSRA